MDCCNWMAVASISITIYDLADSITDVALARTFRSEGFDLEANVVYAGAITALFVSVASQIYHRFKPSGLEGSLLAKLMAALLDDCAALYGWHSSGLFGSTKLSTLDEVAFYFTMTSLGLLMLALLLGFLYTCCYECGMDGTTIITSILLVVLFGIWFSISIMVATEEKGPDSLRGDNLMGLWVACYIFGLLCFAAVFMDDDDD
eukprot:TRINITY_DN10462_c0_g2_i1.p2 TRINITY_DN10462_c0_g2~~TRINITY_DN10462_c0_g2_i1.p2  ORF type:complete len:204 (+),score=33.63 TRINITY_DN10462_c0_g2_i1:1531-2142(+)